MIPNLTLNEETRISDLLNKAPGNFFALNSGEEPRIPARYYKDKRGEFWNAAKSYLNSDLAGNGIFTIMAGTTRKVKPAFTIQKGDSSTAAPVIFMNEPKTDIALVKENAELKAKLHYLELQLADLQENLEDAETSLEEAPESDPQKNPWLALAEQLAPAAGQLIAGIAAKYLTPQQPTPPQQYAPEYRTPTRSGYNSADAMESRNFGRNAEPNINPVQSAGFDNSSDV
jgi:hypothetical protein